MIKPKRGPIMLRMGGGGGRPIEIPATIVGDLAVHRRGQNADGPWVVSHIESSALVTSAYRGNHSQRAMIAWAIAWQEGAPDFFAALRGLGFLDGGMTPSNAPAAYALAREALNIARTL